MEKTEDRATRDAAPQDRPPEPQEAPEPRAPVRTPVIELFAGSCD
jgi:hypothetical protein